MSSNANNYNQQPARNTGLNTGAGQPNAGRLSAASQNKAAKKQHEKEKKAVQEEYSGDTCCFCVPLDLGMWILTFYMMAYGAACHVEFIVFLVNFSYYKTGVII